MPFCYATNVIRRIGRFPGLVVHIHGSNYHHDKLPGAYLASSVLSMQSKIRHQIKVKTSSMHGAYDKFAQK
jgi:hypothetical protein